MPGATDLDSLMRLVRLYYPPGVEAEDPAYRKTEQNRRLRSLLGGVARDMGDITEYAAGHPPVPDGVHELGATDRELRAWPRFLDRLRREFGAGKLWNKTIPFHAPCYSCQVYLPDTPEDCYDAVVCLLSLLAPVYTIHGCRDIDGGESWVRFPPLPHEFQALEQRLAALIESEFGFARLNKDVLLTPIPDRVPYASNLMLGEARLIDCLFDTEHPDE